MGIFTKNYKLPRFGMIWNLYKDALSKPHILVAGATGSGKSVVVNGLIATILHRLPVDKEGGAQMILIDPKRVELAEYKRVPHTLMHTGGFFPTEWEKALKKALFIMEQRYARMERKRLKMYDGGDLYVVIDEWAEISATGGKGCKNALLRLASEGRGARVHVILATQFPTARILPTEIRGNFDWRIALRTSNAVESRIVLGRNGCEDLPDNGEGYYILPGKDKTIKVVIPMVPQEELEGLAVHWERQRGLIA